MVTHKEKAATVVGALEEELTFGKSRRRPSPQKARMAHVAKHSTLPPALPRTRRLARELGIDLTQLVGTGPHGVITENDVRKKEQT